MATIDFIPERETVKLSGAASIARHPIIAAYLRREGGVVESDGLVLIPTRRDELAKRFQVLTRLLGKVGVTIESQGAVSEELEVVEKRERRFEVFSSQAREIWSAKIDTDEFRAFVSAVEKTCPGRTFYRMQLLSAFHLAFSQNACNFSVPGAGKTSVVYAAYAYLSSLPRADPKSVDRLLIVGPLSSFKAWEDEYEEIFLRKALAQRLSGSVSRFDRTRHLRGISSRSRRVELTVTSYQTLANMEEDFAVFLTNVAPNTMVVLDEAHYIKSADGFQSAAALRLAPFANSRVVLTGTPAPNGYEDLANLFQFLYPNRNIIGFPTASLRAMTDGSMPRAVPELKSRIEPFYTRIRKKDLALPEVREFRVPVEMTQEHERIYRGLESRVLPQLRRALDSRQSSTRVRARLIRLRQASVSPELLLRPLESDDGIFETGDDGDLNFAELEISELIRQFDSSHDLTRLEVCRSLVADILKDQGKILIWSYFIGNLQMLRTALCDLAPFTELLTGATPVSQGDEDEVVEGTREEIIDRFHSCDGRAILIANPQAVGESISLHKACRSAIYFDRDFNAGRYIQSKDRIHRYNPAGGGVVSYYYLVTSDTVDQSIDDRLITKEKRLADLVDADDIPLLTAAQDSDLSDLQAILNAYEQRKTK